MKKFLVYFTLWLFIGSWALNTSEAIAAEINDLLSPASKESADEIVRVHTVWSQDRAHPGSQVILAVIFDVPKDFHINADQSQIITVKDLVLIPTKVQMIKVPEGITVESPRFPQADQLKAEYADQPLMVFSGRTVIYLAMKIDETVKPGQLSVKLQINYQACDKKTCYMPKKPIVKESFEVVELNQKSVEINKEIFKGYYAAQADVTAKKVAFDLFGLTFSLNVSFWWGKILLMLTAAVGGVMLNFTPCVLPIIPIKIMSLSTTAEDRKRCVILGLTMSLGVLVFWLALGTMVALISGFTAANQLFQYPVVTILIGGIIAVMAVGMWGQFSFRLPDFIYMINPNQNSLMGSFGLGILTAILSTPCTAPFMGAAAAWAATQNPVTTIITFGFIGSGMALPYLILSASPSLVKKMPKTGPASELIKQVMGLFMLAAAAYFVGSGLSVLLSKPPDPPETLYWWVVMAFCAAAGGWLVYRTVRIAARRRQTVFFVALGIIVIALSFIGGLRLTDRGPINWINYTPERFNEAVAQQKIIVLDFTAEWCLNCKALEHGVLNTRKIINLFASSDIAPIKVDITGNNPSGKEKLKQVGSLTIPLLVVYSPDKRIVFKSDFYTADQIVDAVRKAREASR
ncbi:MAG: thioredoxin family protein [Deltaproteobacteria bacterium]|nr:thioredoxin family protein [Deltaproteobacteria bacterium]